MHSDFESWKVMLLILFKKYADLGILCKIMMLHLLLPPWGFPVYGK